MICENLLEKNNLTAESINDEVKKIIEDPIFVSSDILRRFLLFIVSEKLEGRSNQLKEYTIGLKVLNKSASFVPQHNAIVRIHARRLRRALHNYYEGNGKTDLVHISIPLGSYVPVFSEAGYDPVSEIGMLTTKKDEAITKLPSPEIIVGVMPFQNFAKNKSSAFLAGGLTAQLSTGLANVKNISVIADYIMQRFAEKKSDAGEIFAAVGAQYIITGEMQFQGNKSRVNIQLFHVTTGRQISSRVYEHRLTPENIFDVQDNIVSEVISLFENYCIKKKRKNNESLLMQAV